MKTWTKKNIFLDELHLDDVLEVLLVAGSEIYQHITCIQIPKKELKKKIIWFYVMIWYLPCRTSPRQLHLKKRFI